MRRSFARFRVDPLKSHIVQKRLPAHVRRMQKQQQAWQEDDQASNDFQPKTDSVVVQISQAAKQGRWSQQLWENLLDQAYQNREEMSPQDMADVLWSMSEARFQHDAILDDFVRNLSHRANVKAMVTAMLALDRLGLPTVALREPFLQQLVGTCDRLSLGDLRRVLMALARCWKAAPAHNDIVNEICAQIADKAVKADPRDLLVVPQHLGRLRLPHAELIAVSAAAIQTILSSRLTVLVLDILRALDGLWLLEPLVATPAGSSHSIRSVVDLAAKCRLFGADLLCQSSREDLWRVGSQLLGAEVTEPRVWVVWAEEVVRRRNEGMSKARGVGQLRQRVVRRWGLQQPPEGLELALRTMLR